MADALALLQPAPSALVLQPLRLDEDGARRLYATFTQGRSPNTQRAYTQSCTAFAVWLSARFGRELDATSAVGELMRAGAGGANMTALEWRDAMKARGLAPGSVNRHLAAIRSLTEMAKSFGMIPWSVAVPGLKSQAYRNTKGPGRAAVRKMLDGVSLRDDAQGRRDYAVMRLLYDLALRRAEVSSLDLEHLALGEAKLSVMRKGKLERLELDLPAETVAALRRWLEVRGDAPGPVFTRLRAGKGQRLTGAGVCLLVKRTGHAVGVRALPHGLRHSSITEAIKRATKAGIGIDEVRDFSGHASVTTLMIYRDKERNVQGRLAALIAADK